MEVNIVIMISIVLAVTLNIAVSIFVFRRDDFEKFQKLIQILILWLVPFLGAMGIYLILKSFDTPVTKSKPPFGGGASDSGFVSAGGGSDNS